MSMRSRLLNDVVDPPVQDIEPGGIVVERAPVEPAADGGISGFPLELTPSATVWDAFSGRPECSNETSDFLQELDDEPRLRSTAILRTLGRVRKQLEAMPEQSALDAPVCVSLSDALVLMTQLMSRLR